MIGSAWRRRLVGVLVVGGLAVQVTAAGAQSLRAGTTAVTLAAGYSLSHDVPKGTELQTVQGVQLLPHLAYVLTDEHGGGFLRGNLAVLAEPTLIHFTDGDSATVVGLSALGRWLFVGAGTVRPYLEAGVGILGGEMKVRQTNCDVNFVLQGGVGAMVFVSPTTALNAGYRFQHISNADQCSKNLGLNSSLFVVGVSYFFP